LPNPNVFDLEAETLSIVDYAVPNTVHPVTREGFMMRVSSSAEKGEIRKAHYEVAMFQRVRSLSNWYWAMNSVSNTFHRLCSQIGACTQQEVHSIALLQPATLTDGRERQSAHLTTRTGQHSSAADELKSCLGTMFWYVHRKICCICDVINDIQNPDCSEKKKLTCRVDHPKMHDEAQWVGDEILVMEKVYFGVGKSVVQPNVALQIDKCAQELACI